MSAREKKKKKKKREKKRKGTKTGMDMGHTRPGRRASGGFVLMRKERRLRRKQHVHRHQVSK